MEYDELIGEMQHRARVSSRGDAESVVRATLETLGERIGDDEAEDLAAQLPAEAGRHLSAADGVDSFDWNEFVTRVAEHEGLDEDDRADAAYHARLVVDRIEDSVSGGEMNDVRDQLPAEYEDLFEVADQEAAPGPGSR